MTVIKQVWVADMGIQKLMLMTFDLIHEVVPTEILAKASVNIEDYQQTAANAREGIELLFADPTDEDPEILAFRVTAIKMMTITAATALTMVGMQLMPIGGTVHNPEWLLIVTKDHDMSTIDLPRGT